MLTKRIISTFLIALMLLSTLALTIGAKEDTPAADEPVYEFNTSKLTATMD